MLLRLSEKWYKANTIFIQDNPEFTINFALRGSSTELLLSGRSKVFLNKRCHWSRMSTVQPANRPPNKGQYSSQSSTVLTT